MTVLFKSQRIKDSAMAFKYSAERLSVAFPELQWDLRRAGYDIDAIQYIAVTLLMTFIAFITVILLILSLIIIAKAPFDLYLAVGIPIIVSIFTFFYVLSLPKLETARMGRLIDKDLEYMLKDMQIQLTAGIPLFNTIGNIAEGDYGACSTICSKIVGDIESGKSINDVLNEYGIISPSVYLRRVLWQISNAIQTGSDVKQALAAISVEIQREKENKIESYGKELSLWGLIYMMLIIVAPSMGITLLLILSSFLGGGMINEDTFWFVLVLLAIIQIIFIYLVRSKRPEI